MIKRILLLFIICGLVSVTSAAELKTELPPISQFGSYSEVLVADNDNDSKAKTWWEKRQDLSEQKDIYYPHNIHMTAMEDEGDACMLCHPYTANKIVDNDQLNTITTISNEAMKEVCHDCHVVEVRAPAQCNLCHPGMKSPVPDEHISWPDDHKFGYINHHSEDARKNEHACKECHLDMTFCTDCHFRRNGAGKGYHPLGYISQHGIDVRMMPSNCGRCHNTFYCQDCHRNRR